MKKLMILLVSILLLTSACKKNNNTEPTPIDPTSMEDLSITSSFDWKTTNDFQLTLTGKGNSIVEVTSNEGITYQKAFLTANVPYNLKLTVPAYEKSVRLKFMGQDISLELDSETLSYQFQ